MKALILAAIFPLWLGCTTEVTTLAVSALRINETASLPGLALLMGWLGLVGFCGWKCMGLRQHADL